jgi:transposase InsO family protein
MQLVSECLAGRESVATLADAFEVSRKTVYYWLRHYEREGPSRLVGASRRPHTSPMATDRAIVRQVLAARRRHPHWSAGKLLGWLRDRAPTTPWPSRSTAHLYLQRAGLVRLRRRRHVVGPRTARLVEPTAPNEVWTIDFKGEFKIGARWCYPLTLRDLYSRFVLRCTGRFHHGTADVAPILARVFAEYGLPTRLRSDNGPPFGGAGLAGLSQLAVWWLRLGITLERIAPGHPEQNGAHEQFHGVLKRETAAPPAATWAAQQQRFRRFVHIYNTERPHDGIHTVPARRYTPSARALPPRVPPLAYSAAYVVRRVSSQGHIRWRGRPVFLSSVLAGHDVAFEEVEDGLWLVRFAAAVLARWNERTAQLEPLTS